MNEIINTIVNFFQYLWPLIVIGLFVVFLLSRGWKAKVFASLLFMTFALIAFSILRVIFIKLNVVQYSEELQVDSKAVSFNLLVGNHIIICDPNATKISIEGTVPIDSISSRIEDETLFITQSNMPPELWRVTNNLRITIPDEITSIETKVHHADFELNYQNCDNTDIALALYNSRGVVKAKGNYNMQNIIAEGYMSKFTLITANETQIDIKKLGQNRITAKEEFTIVEPDYYRSKQASERRIFIDLKLPELIIIRR